ncbi:MAG: hypothetical protein HFG35_13010 [Eubacterium sp.]|nr:hypothetical protein [Eubacterium sp.]
MDSYKEKKLREEFCDILFELAKSQELFQDVHIRVSIYKRLENLYGWLISISDYIQVLPKYINISQRRILYINVIFGLLFYINKLVCDEEKIKPLIISNIILLFMILCTIVAWYFGSVETRNHRVFVNEISWMV